MTDPKQETASPFSEHVLAAIVFTDVVDYSARMGQDADGTLSAVEADFKRLRTLCARYGGTVHNTMGDGMLMCFTSATHAVVCALRAQQEFAVRTRANPDALRHRIGIHMGDITLGADGVSGDGVNIAARILTLATPGGACVSEAVHRAVKSHMRLKVEPMGTPQLKNITESVPVCRVDIQESKLPMRARIALSGRKRWWTGVAAAVTGVTLAGLAWFLVVRRGVSPAPSAIPAAAALPGVSNAAFSAKSVAVLPFADLSAGRDQEYFSDGIAEELINTLSRLPEIRVAARSSAFAFKGRNVAATEIGRELKVGTLIEGSVRKVESRVRITVRLTSAAEGFQLWSETFDRSTGDLFALQVEIARTIAQKLQLTLNADARTNLERSATDSIAAHTLYLRARHLLAQRGDSTAQALPLFEKAIVADPYYALAYAGMADCHVMLTLQGAQLPAIAMPMAFAAADRARELDTALPDAWATAGFIRFYHDWDAKAADDMFQQALRLNPNHAGALGWRAATLAIRGQAAIGIADAVRARDLDPLSASANLSLGWTLLLAGRAGEARPVLEKARELNPDLVHAHNALGILADAAGDYGRAATHYEAGLERVAASITLQAGLARARGLQGRTDEAREILEKILQQQKTKYVRSYLLAVAHTGIGNTDAALDALARAVEERDPSVPTLRNAPTFDSLRNHPRYQIIEQSVGLWPRLSSGGR